MTIVRAHMSISLDGYTSGANQRFEQPFGDNTEGFNDWMFRIPAVRRMFGLEGGGDPGPSDDVFTERTANIGAIVMGRQMFGGGPGPWKADPVWKGWWGDNPPYHCPVYVLTHYPRGPQPMAGGTTFHFVTEGPAAALAHARESAGDKDVVIAGGAQTVQQYLALGAIDELELHLVPMLIGGGARLLDHVPVSTRFEPIRTVSASDVTHLRYRVVR
jgi:dihydrofolate reductase